MMTNESPQTRPYFLPPEINYEALSDDFKMAINELVQPAYEELVLQAPDAMERAAGSSFVCLLLIELLDQFDMGRQMARRLNQQQEEGETDNESQEDLLRFFRTVSAKEKAGNFLMRIRNFREKNPAPPDSSPPQAKRS